ncbi:MFS transporter [Sphingobium subterraneum]|uniref:Putative MFS family arabinose efflux permease n=1 Tax=Sphingobium subterraneum TaxID=627688 RepID=A0A841J9Q7_9SPHN|nr:MFS transporter [Sphingobium subterraneum]MBB6125235.1 putative MFS family arabinose efflux permease [Sphingobium subterraneum]
MTQISGEFVEPWADGPLGRSVPQRLAKEEWARQWPLVAVAALATGTSTASFISLSTLLPAILAENGWTRVQAMSAALIFSISALLLSPFLGRLVDRVGIRRVAVPGAAIFALCQCAIGFSGHSIESWWGSWVVASVGMQLIGPAVWAAAIAPRFVKSRGLALGLTMAGAGLSPLLVPVVSTMVSEAIHWRYFYFLLSGFGLLVLLPLLYATLPREGQAERRSVEQLPSKAGASLGEALASSLYWRLLLAILLVSATIGFLLLTMPYVLADKGYSAMAAATIASIYGPAQIISRIGGGYLLDRVRGDLLAAFIFLLPMVACLLLLKADTGPWLMLAPAFAGFAAGVEVDVMAYLISRYFGLRQYGAIYGILFGVFSISLGTAPLIGAMLRQAYGSYEPALWIASVALLASSAIMCTLGRYRY